MKRNCPQNTPNKSNNCSCNMEANIMGKISRKFATTASVAELANEIRKVNGNIGIKASEAATVAAGLVLKQIRPDLEALQESVNNKKSIRILLAGTTEDGFPDVQPEFNVLYVIPSINSDETNKYEEWIAVPTTKTPGWEWEHVGARAIDLSWVNASLDELNKQIHKINCKLSKFSKNIANAIVEKAIRPYNQLREYIESDEFIEHIIEKVNGYSIPIIDINDQSGNIHTNSTGQVKYEDIALIHTIKKWITQSHYTDEGGAIDNSRKIDDLWNSV